MRLTNETYTLVRKSQACRSLGQMLFHPMKYLLPFFCLFLHAQAAERVALVIGNNEYVHARPLETAVNDSTAVSATLKKLGFETITASNASLEQMVEAMEKLKQQSVGAQAVLVYYAGHGIEAQGGNYLIPVDAHLEREIQLKTQALSLEDVLSELKFMAVPARMVILDCCRDNPLEGRSWLATRAYGGGLGSLLEDSLQEATLVVYAASPGKPALDRVTDTDTHSPFTQALIQELPQPGIHSFEVFGRIEERVLHSTASRQKPRLFYNGSTLPFRNFTFAKATAQQPVPEPTPAPAMPTIAQTPLAAAPTPSAAYPNPVIQMAPPSADPAYPNGGGPAQSLPQLPASGYFSVNELFSGSPYAAYNDYSKKEILRRAQAALKNAGYYTSTPDGIIGTGTQRALNSWQQNSGLPITGKLDNESLQKLGLSGISSMSAPATGNSQSKPGFSRPKSPTYQRPTKPSYDAF